MKMFRSTLVECNLVDLGYNGRWYTWEMGNFASTNIRERLDQGVTSPRWWEQFPNSSVTHLSHSMSDHYPILVDTLLSNFDHSCGRKKQFRFNAEWYFKHDFEGIVANYRPLIQLIYLKIGRVRFSPKEFFGKNAT